MDAYHVVQNQIRILYSQSVITFFFPLLVAPAMGAILWDISSHKILLVWTGSVILYSLFRYLIIWLQHKSEITPENAEFWHDLFTGSVFISGILWGVAPIILVPYEPARLIEFTLYNSLAVLILCGLVAGAVVAYSVSKWVLFFYSFPAMVPPAFYLISLGDKYNSALGGFVLLYFVFITASSFRLHRQFLFYLGIEYKMDCLSRQYEGLMNNYQQLKQSIHR